MDQYLVSENEGDKAKGDRKACATSLMDKLTSAIPLLMDTPMEEIGGGKKPMLSPVQLREKLYQNIYANFAYRRNRLFGTCWPSEACLILRVYLSNWS